MGWHSDNEPLSGECGEEKLIASVSFGTRALFKWNGKSCLDSKGCSCWLGHGDILVMDGQCQDEFLHCTDSGLEQERIIFTFRLIHTASCPLRTGTVCLPTCSQGSTAAVTEFVENGTAWLFWLLQGVLFICGVLALLVHSLMCVGRWLRRRAYRWTRPLGGGRRGHRLRGFLAVIAITGCCHMCQSW